MHFTCISGVPRQEDLLRATTLVNILELVLNWIDTKNIVVGRRRCIVRRIGGA
jgi:hypothetical protein